MWVSRQGILLTMWLLGWPEWSLIERERTLLDWRRWHNFAFIFCGLALTFCLGGRGGLVACAYLFCGDGVH